MKKSLWLLNLKRPLHLPQVSFCSGCGNRVPLKSTFCNNCGTPIAQPSGHPGATVSCIRGKGVSSPAPQSVGKKEKRIFSLQRFCRFNRNPEPSVSRTVQPVDIAGPGACPGPSTVLSRLKQRSPETCPASTVRPVETEDPDCPVSHGSSGLSTESGEPLMSPTVQQVDNHGPPGSSPPPRVRTG